MCKVPCWPSGHVWIIAVFSRGSVKQASGRHQYVSRHKVSAEDKKLDVTNLPKKTSPGVLDVVTHFKAELEGM